MLTILWCRRARRVASTAAMGSVWTRSTSATTRTIVGMAATSWTVRIGAGSTWTSSTLDRWHFIRSILDGKTLWCPSGWKPWKRWQLCPVLWLQMDPGRTSGNQHCLGGKYIYKIILPKVKMQTMRCISKTCFLWRKLKRSNHIAFAFSCCHLQIGWHNTRQRKKSLYKFSKGEFKLILSLQDPANITVNTKTETLRIE